MLAAIVCLVMVVLTVGTHYEGLQLLTRVLDRSALHGRAAMLIVILWLFALHSIEIGLYAVAFMVMAAIETEQSFGGFFTGQWIDYFYFSAVSYTSLGIGDVYPHGGPRLVAGIEALNGLMMIAWSASYSYLMMERLWGLPGKSNNERGKD